MKRYFLILSLLTVSECKFDFLNPFPALTRRNGTVPPIAEIFVPKDPSVVPEIKVKPRVLGCKNQLKIPEGVQRVFFSSPGYPNNYPPKIKCSYTITSPPNTKMEIICEDFEVPCKKDQMNISSSGDPFFRDVRSPHCGSEICAFAKSKGNILAIGLKAGGVTSAKRRFQCKIKVTPAEPSKPPPPKPKPTSGVGGSDLLTKVPSDLLTKVPSDLLTKVPSGQEVTPPSKAPPDTTGSDGQGTAQAPGVPKVPAQTMPEAPAQESSKHVTKTPAEFPVPGAHEVPAQVPEPVQSDAAAKEPPHGALPPNYEVPEHLVSGGPPVENPGKPISEDKVPVKPKSSDDLSNLHTQQGHKPVLSTPESAASNLQYGALILSVYLSLAYFFTFVILR